MMKLTPKQVQAEKLLVGDQRHTLLPGGSRSGKTSLIIKAIGMRAVRAPKSRHAILRFRSNAARSSISLDTLPKVFSMRFPEIKLVEHRQDGYFELPNGSQIWIGGLEDQERVEKILGREYVTIFFNECSQIPYQSVVVALTRLAQVCKEIKQRAYYDLNPVGRSHWTNQLFGQKRDPVSKLPLKNPDDYVRFFMNPIDNKANLSPEYLASLEGLPERQRKRFYEGLYVDEFEGALWTYEGIEVGRVDDIPERDRQYTVVAVDPSGAGAEDETSHDEIGIIVACRGVDGHAYILEDRSLRDAPAIWARAAIQAYREYKAQMIVAEINYGGAMVKSTLRGVDPNVPVKVITSSRGKVLRASPVAALYGDPPEYKNRKVHHVGRFAVLEDQLCAFTTSAYRGEGSPDRADAAVFAVTELMIEDNASLWLEYYSKMVGGAPEEVVTDRKLPKGSNKHKAPDPDNKVIEAYDRVMGKALEKKTLCGFCQEVVGNNRATDGIDIFHVECYHQKLKQVNSARAN